VKVQRIDSRFSDYDQLLALILRAFAFMDGRIDPPSSAHLLTPASLREKAKIEIAYVASEDSILVGCIFLNPEPDCLYIGKLAVAPEAQGQGIGRCLLDAAIQTAKELGLSQLRLQTRIELLENHAVFGRWGFRKTAEMAHPGFTRSTFIEMRMTL
jgi:N-acetylglutamate synthase-like GNAT family acetyltransferase